MRDALVCSMSSQPKIGVVERFLVNSLYKKAELVANIAIITVALLLGFVLVKRFIIPSSNGNRAGTQDLIKTGSKLSLPDYDWSKSNEHLVLVLQTKCHFCSESATFYQRLLKETAGGSIEAVAVLPEDKNESGRYLNDLGLLVREVKQVNFSLLGIKATPTILLVDSAGVVIDVWTGKLPPDKESEVLERMKANCGC